MALFWFVAGALTTLAALVVILPFLRTVPRLRSLPALPRAASIGAVMSLIAILALYRWVANPEAQPRAAAGPGVPAIPAGAFGSAAKAFASATGAANSENAAANVAAPNAAMAKPAAGSMDSAVASLEARLAKGSGSDGDWELLAKSFEFLGRPADAAKARARQLPSAPPSMSAAAAGAALSGEITLAPALKDRAAAGDTLFIVAKSIDSPGVPVAVLRSSVGNWPLKFTLDDSLSMLPGRNLSSAGRVTIEARISQKGQALPAAGDLQGTTGVINPADRRPLRITIDRVIT